MSATPGPAVSDPYAPPASAGRPAPAVEPAAPAADRRIPGIGHALLFFLMFHSMVASLALPYYAIVAVVTGLGDASTVADLVFNGAANTVAIALLLLIGKAWARRPWGEILPFERFWHPALLALVPLALGLGILLSEADNLTRAVLPMPDFLARMMSAMFEGGAASAAVLLVVAPLTEEALLRGFVLNGLRKRHSAGAAIAISAALFALFHLNPYQMLGAFALGLVLGWLRLRTGSLWPCVALHALNNGLSLAVMLLPWRIPGVNTLAAGDFQPPWLDAIGAVLLAAGAIPLLLALRGRNPGAPAGDVV